MKTFNVDWSYHELDPEVKLRLDLCLTYAKPQGAAILTPSRKSPSIDWDALADPARLEGALDDRVAVMAETVSETPLAPETSLADWATGLSSMLPALTNIDARRLLALLVAATGPAKASLARALDAFPLREEEACPRPFWPSEPLPEDAVKERLEALEALLTAPSANPWLLAASLLASAWEGRLAPSSSLSLALACALATAALLRAGCPPPRLSRRFFWPVVKGSNAYVLGDPNQLVAVLVTAAMAKSPRRPREID